jgi:endonuclease G
MKSFLTLLTFLLVLLTGCVKDGEAQRQEPPKKLRDSVLVNADIFRIMYSETLEQPLWIRYRVKCTNGTASRTGMDFYTNDTIHTSDAADYANNVYDKGHLAPAAAFNCTREQLYQTFTYLNCALQNQYLNRGTWRLLESYERDLAKEFDVDVFIRLEFSTLTLPTGARVPAAFHKEIQFNGKRECFYFKNEKPLSSNPFDYRCR